jgi:hypothetical protein
MSIKKIILKSAVQTVRAIVGRSLSEPLISMIMLINMIGLHRVENHVNHKNHIKISGSDSQSNCRAIIV